MQPDSLSSYILTFEKLNGGSDDSNGVLGDERIFAECLLVNNAETQATTVHYHQPARSFLKQNDRQNKRTTRL